MSLVWRYPELGSGDIVQPLIPCLPYKCRQIIKEHLIKPFSLTIGLQVVHRGNILQYTNSVSQQIGDFRYKLTPSIRDDHFGGFKI
jgi:hypothetical protein